VCVDICSASRGTSGGSEPSSRSISARCSTWRGSISGQSRVISGHLGQSRGISGNLGSSARVLHQRAATRESSRPTSANLGQSRPISRLVVRAEEQLARPQLGEDAAHAPHVHRVAPAQAERHLRAVRPRCGRGAAEVRPRCGRGGAEVQPRSSPRLSLGRAVLPRAHDRASRPLVAPESDSPRHCLDSSLKELASSRRGKRGPDRRRGAVGRHASMLLEPG